MARTLRSAPAIAALALACAAVSSVAAAHGIGGSDAEFVATARGAQIAPFMYLGAKHMVTGYDHLLFILGVIFFLYRLRDVALYVTLFSIGHSLTLLAGVLFGLQVNPYAVDAVIGLSVVYKAFENLGGFRALGVAIDTRAAVLVFGLIHGFGLATKLQALRPHPDGLIANLVAFNVGVELGQLLALSLMLVLILAWRRLPGFGVQAVAANILIMTAGVVLTGVQIAGLLLNGNP